MPERGNEGWVVFDFKAGEDVEQDFGGQLVDWEGAQFEKGERGGETSVGMISEVFASCVFLGLSGG